MTGPFIMSIFINGDSSWRKGYLTVALVQSALVVILFITLPLWKKAEKSVKVSTQETDGVDYTKEALDKESENVTGKEKHLFRIKGVKPVLLVFLLYCATESTLGLWGSSFLVNVKGISVSTAAQWVAMFYGGITLGRFFSGFMTLILSNKRLIRLGQFILILGAILFILPFSRYLSLLGFIFAGLGCAPIYPCMLHETPVRFGKENSQSLMGIQMAFAYTGSTFLPPVFGYAASLSTMAIFPFAILAYVIIMLISSEKLNLFFRNGRVQ
jgi:fucose permease